MLAGANDYIARTLKLQGSGAKAFELQLSRQWHYNRLFSCRTSRTHRRAVHTAHACGGTSPRLGFRVRCCHGRCLIRVHRRVRVDLHYRRDSAATSGAPFCRWCVSNCAGVRTILSKPSEKPSSEKRKGLLSAYGSTFFLTLTNPVTILSFVAIFAGIGLGSAVTDYGSAALLVFAVFAGSTLWWLILSGIVSLVRKGVTPKTLTWINKASGFIIVVFGFLILISLFV